MTSKNRHLSIPKRFWNFKKKKGLHPFRHSHRFRRPADPNQGTPIKCQTHARKRLDSPSTSNSWNACLWWANATTDLSKKFCKQSSGKDFPIDKRSLNHRSVIALFLHHSSTNRRSAEEESVASRRAETTILSSSSSKSPSHVCWVAITDRIDRSTSNVRPLNATRISTLAIIFVGHGDAWSASVISAAIFSPITRCSPWTTRERTTDWNVNGIFSWDPLERKERKSYCYYYCYLFEFGIFPIGRGENLPFSKFEILIEAIIYRKWTTMGWWQNNKDSDTINRYKRRNY